MMSPTRSSTYELLVEPVEPKGTTHRKITPVSRMHVRSTDDENTPRACGIARLHTVQVLVVAPAAAAGGLRFNQYLFDGIRFNSNSTSTLKSSLHDVNASRWSRL